MEVVRAVVETAAAVVFDGGGARVERSVALGSEAVEEGECEASTVVEGFWSPLPMLGPLSPPTGELQVSVVATGIASNGGGAWLLGVMEGQV